MERAREKLRDLENVVLLGPQDVDKLPIFSFMIRHGSRFLHYNFVCVLLNDLFGIQSRGGCMCAGPYALNLLGIDSEISDRIFSQMDSFDEAEILRPGFTRINFNYFVSESEFQYVLRAVEFVAKRGWQFLCEYSFNASSNEWYHRCNRKFPFRTWLDIKYKNGHVDWKHRSSRPLTDSILDGYLQEAQMIADRLTTSFAMVENMTMLSDGIELLRWFTYPGEDSDSPNFQNFHLTPKNYSELVTCCSPPDRRIPIGEFFSGGVSGSKYKITVNRSETSDKKRERKTITNSNLSANPTWNTTTTTTATATATTTTTTTLTTTSTIIPMTIETLTPTSLPTTTPMPPTPLPQATSIPPTPTTTPIVTNVTATTDTMEKTPEVKEKEKKFRNRKLTRELFSTMTKAIQEFSMILDGDRVLVALSGGKDSLTLLHLLKQLQQSKKIKFSLGATTVDPQYMGYDPTPLIPYVSSLEIPYHYNSQGLINLAQDKCPSSICAWCSRMKRGILVKTARDNGYNKIATGQHLDDLAESFLMFAFHNGKLDTMKASSRLSEGDVTIIRPLIYVRELQTKRYSKWNNLPVISENCPACFSEPKERKRIKSLLASQENLFPELFNRLRTAMHPLMHGRMDVKAVFEQLMEEDQQYLSNVNMLADQVTV
eukprot:TRINITY_DN4056_c0_g5_i1.p1 TRINITY_DN4056_c0_g5~~TRINITY_DN4056_c0_g5_i1.p1  ORF type:complete len:657 (+),score=132.55 TRINITY_DN4056_c0_g5_i1:1139-3109(+)